MKLNIRRVTDHVSGITVGGWTFWYVTRFLAVFPSRFGVLDGGSVLADTVSDHTLVPILILVPLTLVAILLQCLPTKTPKN